MRAVTRRGLLRFRVVRWPFYRLVSLRNYAFAGARWGRNLLAWFLRASYYRGLFLWNWCWFACRWLGNYVVWLLRFLLNWLRAMASLLRHLAHTGGRVAVAPAGAAAAVVRPMKSALLAKPAPVQQPPQARERPAPTLDAKIVIHAYFVEALPPLLDAIEQLQAAIGQCLPVLVTTSADRAPLVCAALEERALPAETVIVDNRGRDILPFLTLARDGRLSDAQLVLKLHTKLSRHRQDGEQWRDALLQGLTDAEAFRRALARARAGEEFVAVPKRFVFGARDWGKNVHRTGQLAASIGIQRLPFRFRFAAGTMFWITPGLLDEFAQVPVQPQEFEEEPLPLDGALPHALERLIGVIAHAHGQGVLATETL
ncbi:MAG: rhamnan synthesis F family protein [Candidatus Nanopelagicales bacterium]